MRYAAMQVLTWGTITGAIGSALLLAALDNPAPRFGIELPSATPWAAVKETPSAGRARARAPAAPASSARPMAQR